MEFGIVVIGLHSRSPVLLVPSTRFQASKMLKSHPYGMAALLVACPAILLEYMSLWPFGLCSSIQGVLWWFSYSGDSALALTGRWP